MDTFNVSPPEHAQFLLNTSLDGWTTRDGKSPAWYVEDEVLHVVPGAGDIMTKTKYNDFYLHIEFRCPDMPEATGQAKGNSGVFLQGRYEIQVLDSHGFSSPGRGDCGAIYNQHAPLINACRPAMEWQSYDVGFRAPRRGQTSHPSLTVFHNGWLIHNNIELLGVTGAAIDEETFSHGPLLLQDHNDLVCYRNIWILELPLSGSDNYDPS